jgi:hypothetical protein
VRRPYLLLKTVENPTKPTKNAFEFVSDKKKFVFFKGWIFIGEKFLSSILAVA